MSFRRRESGLWVPDRRLLAASQQVLLMGGASAVAYSKWNSADKDAAVSLSGSDLVATTTASDGAVRGTQGRAHTDNRYFEVTISNADKFQMVGIGNASATLASYPGADANGYGYYCYDGQKYNNGASAYATQVVLGVDVDLSNNTIRFVRGGKSIGAAFTSMSSGSYFIMWGTATSTGAHNVTLNAGATGFAYEGYRQSVGASAWGASETWNSADKDADVTLSGGDLTASVANGSNGGIRSVGSKSTGRHYFELTLGGDNFSVMGGVAKSTASVTNGYPGNNADGYGYWWSNGQKYNNGSGTGYSIVDEVVGVQLTSGTLYFVANGVRASAFTGLSGTFYPMWGSASGNPGSRVGTLNVGASAFALALPSGASAWG